MMGLTVHTEALDSLRQDKADLFLKVFGPNLNEKEKNEILAKEENSDLKQLLKLMEDNKNQQVISTELSSMKDFKGEYLSGKGNFGQSYANGMAEALMEGRLDASTSAQGGKLEFTKEKVEYQSNQVGRNGLSNSEPRLTISAANAETSTASIDFASLANYYKSPASLDKAIQNEVFLSLQIENNLKEMRLRDNPAEIAAVNKNLGNALDKDKQEQVDSAAPEQKGPEA
jgi:hypothetical protein